MASSASTRRAARSSPACGTCTRTTPPTTGCSTSPTASPRCAIMANDTDFLIDLRKKWDSGAAIGPRVVHGRHHRRAGQVRRADEGARRYRGAGARRGRQLREARLRADQDLQLGQAGAGAGDHARRARARAARERAHSRVHARRGSGAGGLRRDPAHELSLPQFLAGRRRHAHAGALHRGRRTRGRARSEVGAGAGVSRSAAREEDGHRSDRLDLRGDVHVAPRNDVAELRDDRRPPSAAGSPRLSHRRTCRCPRGRTSSTATRSATCWRW